MPEAKARGATAELEAGVRGSVGRIAVQVVCRGSWPSCSEASVCPPAAEMLVVVAMRKTLLVSKSSPGYEIPWL